MCWSRIMADPCAGPATVEGPLSAWSSLWEAPSPRSALQFWDLERQVFSVAEEMADQLIGEHLTRLHQDREFVDQAVREARARHAGPLVHKGLRLLSVLLPGGTRYLVDTPYLRPKPRRRPGRKRTRRGPKGAGLYPVLEALGIRDGVSPATRSQLALYTVQAGSYREAVVLLAQRGLVVEPSTLRRVAQSTARADIRLRDAALEQARQVPLPADGPLAGLRVRVSVDGGRVRTRHNRPGHKTKKGRHRYDTPWREPRVLVVDILDEEGKAERLRLPLYEVLLDDAEATVAVVIGYLRLLGAAQARVVEFIADGAEWIWQRSEKIRQEAEILEERWVEAVDFYHASEHLHDAVELCRNLSPAQRQKLYEQLRHVLRTDAKGVDKVIARLQEEARGRRAKKMKEAIGYFEKHAKRMAYVDLDDRHLAVGSGPVESAVRRVINLRFKAPGNFWTPGTVADLMHLRAGFKAGRWGELMERVLTQRYCVPSFARLTAAQIRTLVPLEPQEENPPPEEARQCA
jgi:hypothetical protein